MKCPKCEEGTILNVILKITGERAKLCDFCDSLWSENEDIKSNTGHPFNVMQQGNAVEYSLDESEDVDQEHRSAKYARVK